MNESCLLSYCIYWEQGTNIAEQLPGTATQETTYIQVDFFLEMSESHDLSGMLLNILKTHLVIFYMHFYCQQIP